MTDTEVNPSTALFESLSPPTQAFIGGDLVDAASGKTFDTLNPGTGEVLAQVADCDREDVDRAVIAARQAFESGPWSTMAPKDRKRMILRFADLVEAHTQELASIETLEAGKPIADTTDIDLPETIETLRWHGEAADKYYDQISPSGPGVVSMIVREPIGVVGAVLPWNFPLLMMAWKIAPLAPAQRGRPRRRNLFTHYRPGFRTTAWIHCARMPKRTRWRSRVQGRKNGKSPRPCFAMQRQCAQARTWWHFT